MNKKHCLMVLKASHLYPVVDSIERIDMETAWFSGYTETELAITLNSFISDTDYDYYWLTSHDLVLHQEGVDCLVEILENDPSCVATGYCNVSLDNPLSTITRAPIDQPEPSLESYGFLTNQSVQKLEDDIIRTYFASWSMSGMTRDMWLKYPYKTMGSGDRTDLNFSMRFCQEESNKIFSHKKASFLHLKPTAGLSMGPGSVTTWLVGVSKPSLFLQTVDGTVTEFDFKQDLGYFS